ncbi:hypothetical protein U737_00130 [Methylomonas sp. LW13]|uniref:hypothetical protein n=1 Tax=unclassified Methylomonas TaxID=2608980 RepID=UPI00051BCC59|nr:hypothetical protein [Methylomonas sp. LW13]QBC25442.1 hypothetical protein U737_00130 [Methylomonas sp. LW13]
MLTLFNLQLEEVPLQVAKLAFELHCQDTQDLVIELTNPSTISPQKIDELFYIEANQLIFKSIAARNHCTAVHSVHKFNKNDSSISAIQIFDEAHQLCVREFQEIDTASGRFLGLMTQTVDVLMAAVEAIGSADSSKVFQILRSIGNALPFLSNFSLEGLVKLVAAQHLKTSGDMAAGMFFNQLINYLSTVPVRAKALYAIVRENIADENMTLYCSALIALAKAEHGLEAVKLALNDVNSDCINLSVSALRALGGISNEWDTEPGLKNDIQKTIKTLVHHPDSRISSQAINTLSNAAAGQHELIPELLAYAKPDNHSAIQVLSSFVFMNLATVKEQPNLAQLLLALTNLQVGYTHHFDSVLARLIKNGTHDQLVYDCLSTWILKNCDSRGADEKVSTCFNQSLMQLINKPLLSELITRWLISDELALGAAFGDVISYLWSHGFVQPAFSKDVLDTLENEDFKYLARRLLGWTFFEEPLLSLTFSLLETKDAQRRTFGWVHALLANDVGRNYPLATQEAIREKLSSAGPEVEKLLQATQAELLARADTIKQLPIRKELYPPMPVRIRHAIALKKEKEEREAREKASEQSIFQQICTRIWTKGGTGSFSIFQGKVSEVNRYATHSIFVTLPAQSVIDPLNDEITRISFRLAKRGDE